MTAPARLFNRIAQVYSLFFKGQVRGYRSAFALHGDRLGLARGGSVLDVGCGTGAFARALELEGFQVTGIDIAEKMVRQGLRRNLDCLPGNVLRGLPYPGRSFDLVSAVFVLHGLRMDERQALFREASRLSRGLVLFHDYNGARSIAIDLVEWLGGEIFSVSLKQVWMRCKVSSGMCRSST